MPTAPHLTDPTRCALCAGQFPRCRSHVVPKFWFKPMKKNGNEIKVFTSNKVGSRRPTQKDGPKPYLLCENCEQKFNDWYEKPFKEMWHDNPCYPPVLHEGLIEMQIPNYRDFKLFHLSVLWRAYAAALIEGKNSIWNQVDLHCHEPRIRSMIMNRDPGKLSDYPISGIFPVYAWNPDGQIKDFMSNPFQTRKYGMYFINMFFAGVEWQYSISGHLHHEFARYCLQENGRFISVRFPLLESNRLPSEMIDNIRRRQL